jgi:hypothetical protein
MTTLFFGFVLLTVLGALANAQVPAALTLSFVGPEGYDPQTKVIFTDTTSTETTSGSNLFPALSDQRGVEIHSQIPGAGAGFIKDVIVLRVDFAFLGTVNLSSNANFGFTPWSTTLLVTGSGQYSAIFTALPSTLYGPINDNFNPGGFPFRSYGTLTAAITNDPNNTAKNAFNNSTVSFTPGGFGKDRPSSVPEPGLLVFGTGMFASVGLPLLRRRRR